MRDCVNPGPGEANPGMQPTMVSELRATTPPGEQHMGSESHDPHVQTAFQDSPMPAHAATGSMEDAEDY